MESCLTTQVVLWAAAVGMMIPIIPLLVLAMTYYRTAGWLNQMMAQNKRLAIANDALLEALNDRETAAQEAMA